MKKVLALVLVAVALVALPLGLSGCQETEAQKVSHNVSQQADAFNVTRRVVVFNTRTDKIWLEVIGLLSVQTDSDGDVNLIIEVAEGQYKKHMVDLNAWTTWVCEDVTGAFVDKYHWEINYQPEALVPIKIVNID